MNNRHDVKRYRTLVAKLAVPAERKFASKANAQWFLRQGILYCETRKQYDEVVSVAMKFLQ